MKEGTEGEGDLVEFQSNLAKMEGAEFNFCCRTKDLDYYCSQKGKNPLPEWKNQWRRGRSTRSRSQPIVVSEIAVRDLVLSGCMVSVHVKRR